MARRRGAAAPDNRELLRAERVYGGGSAAGRGEHRVGLCYPNRYSVAMANLGYQTVLSRMRRHDRCEVDRFFCDEGEGEGPLLGFESGRPAGAFDVLAFSVSFENDYVNMLRMLRRARVPLRRGDREEGHPLIVVGGAVTFLNPEPLRPFVDLFLLGEGEEMVDRFLEVCGAPHRPAGRGSIERLAAVEGAYLPELHRSVAEVEPRRFDAMATDPALSRVLTPYSEFRDTLLLEISRGCPRRCRFCTVGSALPKFRMLPAERAVEIAERFREEDERTGREPLRNVGLVSAAFFDHPESGAMAAGLHRHGFRIGVSSLRVDHLTDEILHIVRESGTRTITVAPEAGSERLRRVIRKDATDDVILEGVRKAARAGFERLRIYYMVGLPFEEEEDREALVKQALAIRTEFFRAGDRARGVSVSLHPFVPKPRTPFQWSRMMRPADLKRTVWRIRRKLPGVKVKCVPRKEAYTEGILARGGEELAPFLERLAAGEGWRAAAREGGIDLDRVLYARRDESELFPWELGERPRRGRGVDLRELARAEVAAVPQAEKGGS